jgi:hypothetical protein
MKRVQGYLLTTVYRGPTSPVRGEFLLDDTMMRTAREHGLPALTGEQAWRGISDAGIVVDLHSAREEAIAKALRARGRVEQATVVQT